MKCILHIGMPKTGTTTIQGFLAENRKKLRASGIAYFESLGCPNNRNLGLYSQDQDRRLNGIRIDEGIYGDADALKGYRQRIRQAFLGERSQSKCSQAILTNEALWLLDSDAQMNRLKDLIVDVFSEIKVIIYLRRQDLQRVSSYSSFLRFGRDGAHEIKVLGSSDPEDYNVKLDFWAKHFGAENLIVRIYEREKLLEQDVVADFLGGAGISLDLRKMKQIAPQNRSMQSQAQEFLALFSDHVPVFLWDERKRNELRGGVSNILSEYYDGKGYQPSRSAAQSYYSKIKESNDRLAGKWFGARSLFNEDFSMYPECATPDLTIDQAIEISSRLWMEQQKKINAMNDALQNRKLKVESESFFGNLKSKWFK